MDEFKSNTDKAREAANVEEKRVVKQISGTANKKERNGIQKFADVFLPEDISSVKNYIWTDVIVPSIKKVIVDTIESLIGYSPSSNKSRGSSPSYRAYYDEPRREQSYRPQAQASSFRFDEYELTFEDATDAIEELGDILDRYGVVRVADYYEVIKQPCPYTWNGYGWYDLRSVRPERNFNGYYVIRMPRPVPINGR